MKEPAFLYYDGDAARDVSHMNRLERGCYFDLIQAQRKFRGFTVEQARKILGKDFIECWDAITLILECENDVYFIPWVKDSMAKRAEFKEIQRERIQNYWDKKNNPKLNRGISVDIPSEIVIENEIVIDNKNFLSFFDLKNLETELLESTVWIEAVSVRHHCDISQVINYIKTFCLDQDVKESKGRTLKDYKSHFINWMGCELGKVKKINVDQVKQPIRKEKTEADLEREKEDRIKEYAKRG